MKGEIYEPTMPKNLGLMMAGQKKRRKMKALMAVNWTVDISSSLSPNLLTTAILT